MKNKPKIFLLVFVVIALFSVFFIRNKNQSTVTTPTPQVNQSIEQFEYPGQDGVDALTLLKQKTTVEQDSVGMVVSISGRKADSNLQEFWAFFINNQMAPVGPSEHITKNSEIITWKIQKY